MTQHSHLAGLALLGLSGITRAQGGLEALDPDTLTSLNPADAARVVLEAMYASDDAYKSDVSDFGVRSHTSISQMAGQLAMGNMAATQVQEKVYCVDPAIEGAFSAWYEVPGNELTSRLDAADPNGLQASGIALKAAAQDIAIKSQTIDEQLEEGGVPIGLFSAFGAPMKNQIGMNVLDPADVLGTYAVFLNAAADARLLAENPTRTAAACAARAQRSNISENARYTGTETVDGNETAVVSISGLNQTQSVDKKTEVAFDKASLAVDLEKRVPVRMRIEGTITQGRDSRPIVIEKRSLDYRQVPRSNMVASYKQVLSIGGWNALGPEAAKAQKQMAELEDQLAKVPASQRALMERMLGNQLEMVKKMASGAPIEVEVIVDEVLVNPGIPGGPPNSAKALASVCRQGETIEECLQRI